MRIAIDLRRASFSMEQKGSCRRGPSVGMRSIDQRYDDMAVAERGCYQTLAASLLDLPPRSAFCRKGGTGYRPLREDVNLKFQQFGVQSRRSPKNVRRTHLSDQVAGLSRDIWSTDAAAALPTPVEPEPFSVPSDNRFRFNEHEHLAPFGPEAKENHPQERVRGAEPETSALCPAENLELVSESQDLDLKRGTCPKTRPEPCQQ